jgi:predicted AAA+ superfamily ATPase
MKKDILKEIIRDFHRESLPDSKKRDVTIPLDSGKIITVSGVRRSGKTFILYNTMKDILSKKIPKEKIPKEKILYINFEDERLDLKQEELDLILQCYRELYPDADLKSCYFLFDEVQNVNGWETFIRRVYDTITRNIFVTGSNSRLLSKEIATSLRGRTVTYEVFPLSFREYLRFHNTEADLYYSRTRARIVHLFEKFLTEGGFPETLLFKDASMKNKVLQEYFDVMLYRDIIERFSITNIPVLKYFIRRIFENITSPVSVNNIYNELKSQGYKIGKNSLYEYLDAAESIYLFLIAKKYSRSVLKQELGEKKVYAVDNGILNAVTFHFSKDYGKLLENALFLELHKNGREVFFYKNKKECDFIAFDKGKTRSIIQVSYTLADKTTRKREIEGLIDTCRYLGVKEGYIITFSEEENMREQGISIKVMPAYKFLLPG